MVHVVDNVIIMRLLFTSAVSPDTRLKTMLWSYEDLVKTQTIPISSSWPSMLRICSARQISSATYSPELFWRLAWRTGNRDGPSLRSSMSRALSVNLLPFQLKWPSNRHSYCLFIYCNRNRLYYHLRSREIDRVQPHWLDRILHHCCK